jgi:E3 ubiquitin-protein ligase HECTD2
MTYRPKPPSFYVSNPFIDGHPEPTLHPNPDRRPNPAPRSYSTSYPDGRPTLHDGPSVPSGPVHDPSRGGCCANVETKRIFKHVEDYLISTFKSFDSVNGSFPAQNRPSTHRRQTDEGPRRRPYEPRRENPEGDYPIANLDPKLLLVGNFAENGSWWTGGQEDLRLGRSTSHKSEDGWSLVSMRSPHINWGDVDEWYLAITEAARPWRTVYDELVKDRGYMAIPDTKLVAIESQILEAQEHLQRLLLKATENILKRPGRLVSDPSDLRFLLLISANPLLHSSHRPFTGYFTHLETGFGAGNGSNSHSRGSGPASGRHSGIIKRILGLMSNSPLECRNHLTAWLARYPESRFVRFKDLVSGFLAYRLVRQNEKKFEARVDVTDGLIPSMSVGRSAASLHAALGQSRNSRKPTKEKPMKIIYQDDWQIKAACQVMACIFTANNSGRARRSLPGSATHQDVTYTTRDRVQARGQILATSDFYITLLDDSDLVADFESWERKEGKLSFCQYPFLLSIGAKIQILGHDAKRQMQSRARDAFFDSIMTRRNVEQLLTLHIRRDCLVEDSLNRVREVIGSGGEDIKKALRIVFTGEEGVDAGGLRKEWFLLLVREVFNPDHGALLKGRGD